MSNFEWFLLVGVVIVVPLLIAIVVTLWTLEMARQRKRSNRPGAAAMIGVKRNATKVRPEVDGVAEATASKDSMSASSDDQDDRGPLSHSADDAASASREVRPNATGPDVDGIRDRSSTV